MNKFIYCLLSRDFFRGLAFGLEHRHEDFLNHINEYDGVTHIAFVGMTFSLVVKGRAVMLIDQYGMPAPPLRWAEQRLLALLIAENIKSFVTVDGLTHEPARTVLFTTPDSDYMVRA